MPAVVFEAKGQIMASAKLARKDLIFPKPRRQSGIKTHFEDKKPQHLLFEANVRTN